MAISIVNVSSPAGETLYTDTAMGAGLDAIKASSALVLWVQVDNTANGGAASYVKLFNLLSGSVTLGTTSPDEVLYTPGGIKRTHILLNGALPGITFGTGLTAACVTTGGTAGTSAPASSVIVTVAFV